MSFRTTAGSANSVASSGELSRPTPGAVWLVRRWRFAPRAEARSQFVRAATGGKSRSRQCRPCALQQADMRRPIVKYALQYKSRVLAANPGRTNTGFEQGRLWRAPALRRGAAPMPWTHWQRHRRQSAHASRAWAAPRRTYASQSCRRAERIVSSTKRSAMRGPKPSRFARKVQPNPSLKRSANGVPPGPRGGAGYHPPRGPGVPPLAPA